MKFLRPMRFFMKNKIHFNRNASTLVSTRLIQPPKEIHSVKKHYLRTSRIVRRHVYTENENEFDDLEQMIDTDLFESEMVKYSVFPNSSDKLIVGLSDCASIDKILNFFIEHRSTFNTQHLLQTVLVLRDMQIMYQRFNNFGSPSSSFINNLFKNIKFLDLLFCIQENLSNFDPYILSELLLYLNRLGIDAENELLQNIAWQLRNNLRENFCIHKCSSLLAVIFRENSVRPYNLSSDLIPKIIGYIDKCDTVDELADLTICLNKLHKLVMQDVLNRYKEKVRLFLMQHKLKNDDFKTILKIIEFLNYPDWRDQNVVLLSDCMLLIQDKINLLKVYEFIKLYGVFQKNQESAELLNNIQRYSSAFLQQIEEGEIVDINTHLILFSTLIYFSTPTHRVQFRKDIKNIFKHCNKYNTSYRTLVTLRKIFSYIKISDKTLCERYWDLTVEMLGENSNINNVINYCQNYLTFNTDLDSYRHIEFEHRIMTFISKTLNKQIIFPSALAHFFSFFVVYGKDSKLMTILMQKFEENKTQFKAVDCLQISHSLLLSNTQNFSITDKHTKKIKDLLNQITKRLIENGDNNFKQTSILLRAAIIRNDYDNYIVENLLLSYKELIFMSSKMLENICFSLLTTSSLIPEVINKCTEYVINNCKNVIAFNVEKILYLCYYLAYYPINADKFFRLATDIIIRDQERLSGLSFLHCALALCFFNKLPGSFIKQIFNVEFMDKLDVELANCYSKEKYPQRVRNCLMQLNRAVCLEYPEYNVPWFHTKFVADMRVKYPQEFELHFAIRVKEYLMKIAQKPDNILENVITPYGYLIDFVININDKGKIVPAESTDIKRRIAILLIRPYAFTRFYTHLKGKYQLKKKHLEMFGYEVSTVIFNEWMNLLYTDERIEYISNLLWPKCPEVANYISKR